ncbi:hypothetical protein [Brevundimonas variabilis]|uniref:Uncharacterized protein n=1 Tax=Brevundimonas variabilis TaxID=74312 RepID=A0A7W9CHC8_9CAUL|nr:hypothetical protein [Brevundimonas variabilis]MBB5745672.1 hypothetical protein [Brevundimonas variabilis]
MNQRSDRWLRRLNLYLGLLIRPFVPTNALGTIAPNHAVMPWGGERVLARLRARSSSPSGRTIGVRFPGHSICGALLCA